MSTTPLGVPQLVEIGQAAPLTGIIPTDLSVEVIKVEKPEGGDDARLWSHPMSARPASASKPTTAASTG
ncbi:hypothetical protein [Belnapia sp. F-4-1]|uniref:hypothetical protein n=1 Tax=Belnapia sp. F-4-1 TaxID=1545443 RepID=UPI001185C33E|nr:hypothetical protein [Belnapia sp. F-4-1]